MHLVRVQKDKAPRIVFTGSRKEVITKIHELKLCSFHDAYFFECGKFEKLGMNGEDSWDYYTIADTEDMSFYENKQF
jgi:DNA-binding Lrp family transcriptional regulator